MPADNKQDGINPRELTQSLQPQMTQNLRTDGKQPTQIGQPVIPQQPFRLGTWIGISVCLANSGRSRI